MRTINGNLRLNQSEVESFFFGPPNRSRAVDAPPSPRFALTRRCRALLQQVHYTLNRVRKLFFLNAIQAIKAFCMPLPSFSVHCVNRFFFLPRRYLKYPFSSCLTTTGEVVFPLNAFLLGFYTRHFL